LIAVLQIKVPAVSFYSKKTWFLVNKFLVNNSLNSLFKGTEAWPIICLGRSVSGGVAAILSIILKSEEENIKCLCYSPPGFLLS
jgi:hypothetical protein